MHIQRCVFLFINHDHNTCNLQFPAGLVFLAKLQQKRQKTQINAVGAFESSQICSKERKKKFMIKEEKKAKLDSRFEFKSKNYKYK